MAQDHSVLGLRLLFSFLSSSASSPKWCVQNCVLDLLGGAVPMELLFFSARDELFGAWVWITSLQNCLKLYWRH